jgi:glutathione S-transferase
VRRGGNVSELILHHFDLSPYAEKVRTLLGLKGLAWRSVQIPMVMPKPCLTALTGGYRKTPVLQIGADIYCDSSCIARELERRFPEPTLFPDGSRGLALALAVWGDRFFEPGAGLAMTVNDQLPPELVKDRREFFTHMDFASMAGRVPHLYAQVRAHLALLDQQLADGRAYLFGDRPGLADATAWYPIWMGHGFLATFAELLAPFAHVQRWQQRMRDIGHGRRSELDAEAALAVARAAAPDPGRGVDAADPLALRAGQRVTVTPDDYGKVPVTGDLVTLDPHEVAVRRVDDRAGEVVVHFPRLGYSVAP